MGGGGDLRRIGDKAGQETPRVAEAIAIVML